MRRTKTSNHGRFSKKQKKASRSLMMKRKGMKFDRHAGTPSMARAFGEAGILSALLPFLFRRGRG